MSRPCPTPLKAAYTTKARALQGASRALRKKPNVSALRAYHCPCGEWHLTKKLTPTGVAP